MSTLRICACDHALEPYCAKAQLIQPCQGQGSVPCMVQSTHKSNTLDFWGIDWSLWVCPNRAAMHVWRTAINRHLANLPTSFCPTDYQGHKSFYELPGPWSHQGVHHVKPTDSSNSKAVKGGSYKKSSGIHHSVKPAAVFFLCGSLWIFILKELFEIYGIALGYMVKIDTTLITVLNMKLQPGNS